MAVFCAISDFIQLFASMPFLVKGFDGQTLRVGCGLSNHRFAWCNALLLSERANLMSY